MGPGKTQQHRAMRSAPQPAKTAAPEFATPSRPSPLSSAIQRAATDARALTPADAVQLQRTIGNGAVGRLLAGAAPRPNRTGLPDRLKAGVEHMSGFALDDVRVHYNSSRPAQVQALAYTQGTHIHVAPGQERHLPHEAWHVVQQKQGRVKPTLQMKGVAINDDDALEREAEVSGRLAAGTHSFPAAERSTRPNTIPYQPIQRKIGFEMEVNVVIGERKAAEDKVSMTPNMGKNDRIFRGNTYEVGVDEGGQNFGTMSTTIIEFITIPQSEWDSKDVFLKPVEQVIECIEVIKDKTRDRTKAIKANEIFSGAADNLWIGMDGMNSQKFGGTFQSTFGIRLSGVKKLFKDTAQDISSDPQGHKSIIQNALETLDDIMPLIRKKQSNKMWPGDIAAIEGYLLLVLQYVWAGKMKKGGTIDKNAVRFLVRSSLKSVFENALSKQQRDAISGSQEDIKAEIYGKTGKYGDDRLFGIPAMTNDPRLEDWLVTVLSTKMEEKLARNPEVGWGSESKLIEPEDVSKPFEEEIFGAVLENRTVKYGIVSYDDYKAIAEKTYTDVRELNEEPGEAAAQADPRQSVSSAFNFDVVYEED